MVNESRERKSLRKKSKENVKYLKSFITRLNNTFDRFIGRLELAEERINELKIFQ